MEAIKLKQNEPMMITWDIGRRCNFDCSYCDLSRHNLTSKPTPYRHLAYTFQFIKKYTKIYNQENANIAFTGGEPTVNPDFWKLVELIKTSSNYTLGLTTNGTFSVKHVPTIIKNFVAVTISWHAEIHKELRDRAIENAILLKNSGCDVRVNVMMHTDLWSECVTAYDHLVDAGVKTNPVIIGDGNSGNTDFFKDETNTLRRTSHPYSQDQQKWFFKVKNLDETIINTIASGNTLPRSCCGNRDLLGSCNGAWQNITAVKTNFKGWCCSVNKYFMHIEEHTGNVYHHQTCKATFSGIGPIGHLSDVKSILEYATDNINNTIVCPNDRCGCGMCAPKSLDKKLFDRLVY